MILLPEYRSLLLPEDIIQELITSIVGCLSVTVPFIMGR